MTQSEFTVTHCEHGHLLLRFRQGDEALEMVMPWRDGVAMAHRVMVEAAYATTEAEWHAYIRHIQDQMTAEVRERGPNS